MDYKEKIIALRQEINTLNYEYYILHNLQKSDREYDKLFAELKDLERMHPDMYDALSPTNRVGSDLSDGFANVNHKFPMLSIANSYSTDEFNEFAQRILNKIGNQSKIRYVAELKFDGLSISLIYINGRLTNAITRGDGVKGDDVIENIKTIKAIPLILDSDSVPSYLEIRGEVVLPRSEFIRINKERAARNEKLYANPRNTASGTLKSHSPAEVASRKLQAYFYQVLVENENDLQYCMKQCGNYSANSHFDRMRYASKLGFNVHEKVLVTQLSSDVIKFLKEVELLRKSLPFDTDGVVIKIDDIALREQIGYTSSVPKWATAYKFETDRVETVLRSVTYQVGRTGVITPVAHLDPVELCQTTVKKATLNNFDWISKMDIRIGDTVYLEKGGEIIPKVVGVNLAKRPQNSTKLIPITTCPECNSIIVKDFKIVAHRCVNEFCGASSVGKLIHFASKDCMNIDGLGPAKMKQLMEKGLVTSFSDIYNLSLASVLSIDRMGHASATKLLNAIEKSKSMPFEKVLYSLCIPKAGEVRVKKLVDKYKDIDTILSLTTRDLMNMDDIGEIIADSIVNFLSDISGEIYTLRQFGLKFEKEDELLNSNALNGKSFCITGTLSKTRDAFKQLITENGGEFHKDVKKNTNFVLVGTEPGGGTLTAADKYSVPKITENDFIQMLGGTSQPKPTVFKKKVDF